MIAKKQITLKLNKTYYKNKDKFIIFAIDFKTDCAILF